MNTLFLRNYFDIDVRSRHVCLQTADSRRLAGLILLAADACRGLKLAQCTACVAVTNHSVGVS